MLRDLDLLSGDDVLIGRMMTFNKGKISGHGPHGLSASESAACTDYSRLPATACFAAPVPEAVLVPMEDTYGPRLVTDSNDPERPENAWLKPL